MKILTFLSQTQGLKLAVANVQNATDFRLYATKIFNLGANLLLKFLTLILNLGATLLLKKQI